MLASTPAPIARAGAMHLGKPSYRADFQFNTFNHSSAKKAIPNFDKLR